MTYHQRSRWQDRDRPSGRPASGLPPGYLEKGYFDQSGNLWPEVIQKWPEELARRFRQQSPALTSTQLRRFFNRARSLERQARAGMPFTKLKEEILGLKVLAAAAVGRKTAPELFKQIIDKNVGLAVDSEDAFTRGFLTHFQGMVAYLKYFENKSERR